MKALSHILLAILLTACTACTLPTPAPPTPPEPPAPVIVRHYIIREYDENGSVKQIFSGVTTFQQTQFPRTVTFTADTGDIITLRGSYEIRESMNTQ